MKRLLLLCLLALGFAGPAAAQSLRFKMLQDTIFEAGHPRFHYVKILCTGYNSSTYFIFNGQVSGSNVNCQDFGSSVIVNPYPSTDTINIQPLFSPNNYGLGNRPEGWMTLAIAEYGNGVNGLGQVYVFKDSVYYKRITPYTPPAVRVTPRQASPGQTLDITITSPTRLDAASSTLAVDFYHLWRDHASAPAIAGPLDNAYFNSFALTSPNTATATITIPPDADTGRYDFMVRTAPNACVYFIDSFRIKPADTTRHFGTLSGFAYLDQDSNCVRDGGDVAAPRMLIRAQSGSVPYYAFTDLGGHYRMQLPYGSYQVSALTRDDAAVEDCQPPRTLTLSAASPFADSVNFRDLGHNDLAVELYAWRFRPGAPAYYYVYAQNRGSFQQTDHLVLQFDTLLSHVSSYLDTMNVDSVVGNRVYFKPFPVAPGGYSFHAVEVSVPGRPGLLGRPVVSQAWLAGNQDAVPHNDTTQLTSVISTSYDPNDKSVDKPEIEPGATPELRYTIRFQNTGTDTAFSIVVRDTLSPLLDVASITNMSATHECDFEVQGNILIARLANILLPDSNVSEPGSHGAISFSIRPKQALMPGERIDNRAAIYFDYNDPVPTNTVTTQLRLPTALVAAQPRLQWAPNPASREVTLQLPTTPTGKLIALDAAGRSRPVPFAVSANRVTADVSTLPPGIYTLRFDDGRQAGRLVVNR